jgi:hypothetical protein
VRLRLHQPLARETSAGGCRRGGAGPWPRSPRRAALPVLGAGRTLGGYGTDGLRLFRARPMPESEASGARERTLATRSRMRGGDRTVGGRARGSYWLQKSTSGAWSWPKGHGSSPLAPCSRRRAQQAKARRKPGRGGESRQHASSDTGGGLLVIPRVHTQVCGVLGGGSTRRWKASWSGAGRRL